MQALQVKPRGLLGEVRAFFLKKPTEPTLIQFPSPEVRKTLTEGIIQRLDIDVSMYSVLNLHRIGIEAPVGWVFEELLNWNCDSVFWPNHIATVERIDGGIERIRVHPLAGGHPHPEKRWWAPPLFDLNALRIQAVPGETDVDNARYLLYACSGGYPIGIFAFYVRSPLVNQGEKERAQLFVGVGFDFYGKEQHALLRPVYWLWERIHNRVTANVLHRLKALCETGFESSMLQR